MKLLHEKLFISHCGVCGNESLDILWDLPKLPLTERYGLYDSKNQLHSDQQLLICNHCGHVQLGMQISPELLYTPSEYSFRTSQSITARTGTGVFFDFFQKVKGNRDFQSLLDIGGNDLFLSKMVECKDRCVIDPVCIADENGLMDNIRVIGAFIEQVDFKKEGLFPDLIFSRHVLEHIANPKDLLVRLFTQTHSNALFIFEIPCLENLVEANRFDAIFHQHYHYFDLVTFKRLIFEAGGEYIAHVHNRQGSCGGSLLIAFRPNSTQRFPLKINLLVRKEILLRAIINYQKEMRILSEKLHAFHQNIYGYGASLMLATLAYHLSTDFSELICILDDDLQKNRIEYQNVPVKVCYTDDYEVPMNSNFLITSLENTRGIFNRIMKLSPRRILSPLVN
jgi:hypothetical protein